MPLITAPKHTGLSSTLQRGWDDLRRLAGETLALLFVRTGVRLIYQQLQAELQVVEARAESGS